MAADATPITGNDEQNGRHARQPAEYMVRRSSHDGQDGSVIEFTVLERRSAVCNSHVAIEKKLKNPVVLLLDKFDIRARIDRNLNEHKPISIGLLGVIRWFHFAGVMPVNK
jgi:hypothetical protein